MKILNNKNSRKELIKHTLTGKHQKRARETIMDLDEAERASPIPQPLPKGASPENMVRMYDPDEDEYYLIPKPKPQPQLMIKPKPIPENVERVYDPDEDDYILVPKKVLPELKRASPPAKTQTVVPCWVCGQTFKNDIGLQTHMKKHWRENVAQDKNFNIKSSFNQRQLYITKSDDSFIKDINEPIDYILDGFKSFKSYKFKVTAPDGEEGVTAPDG